MLKPLKAAIVYYDHFAPLDVYGPMQAMNLSFGLTAGEADVNKPLFRLFSVAERTGFIQTGLGGDNPQIFCSNSFATLPPVDLVLIPGGMGSRALAEDEFFTGHLGELVRKTPLVLSVCTGAGLLARTGFLEYKKATSNKTRKSWNWVISQGENIHWDYKPRWVGELNRDSQSGYMTSAGVAAGMDMMLAVIDGLFGHEIVKNTQNSMEYTWNSDPAMDPFSKLCADCQ